MTSKLYIHNIPWNTEESQIIEFFSKVGPVKTIKMITDRETGRSKGACYIEMEEGDRAIQELNNTEFLGKNIRINPARERNGR